MDASCDAAGLTCLGSFPNWLGCNPIFECDGVAWSRYDFSAFAGCGPVYAGAACEAPDASCAAPLLCLRDGGICVGSECVPFLPIAPGCACGPGDHAHLPLCGSGSFDLVCSAAGRFDGVYKAGLCGE